MYAIVETGGKQVKVECGKVVKVEKLPVEVGEKVVFEKVLFVHDDNGIRIGRPYVEGVTVEGKVLEHFKDKKVIIMKHKRRKNYRRKKGHRQWLTSVKIDTIGEIGESENKAEDSSEEAS